MTDVFADIILFDNIGSPYDGNTMHESGMGGSEFQAILLLEELAKEGYKIICLNNYNTESFVNGVLYAPNNYINKYKFKCNNLIIHRYSDIPKIAHKKAFMWATDLNGVHNLKFYKLFEEKKLTLITLSQFQNDLFPKFWDKHIIYFMIPDWVYEYSIPENKKNFIYASSLMKGYSSTLPMWKYLKDQKILSNTDMLNVCLPGYDNPVQDISDEDYGVNYLGTLTFKEVIELMAKCRGMFYVNTMPETFGISVVLADILKTTPFVYGANNLGGLPELVNNKYLTVDMQEYINMFKNYSTSDSNPKNFRPKMVIKWWKKILV
jgi:hypothetical protein